MRWILTPIPALVDVCVPNDWVDVLRKGVACRIAQVSPAHELTRTPASAAQGSKYEPACCTEAIVVLEVDSRDALERALVACGGITSFSCAEDSRKQ